MAELLMELIRMLKDFWALLAGMAGAGVFTFRMYETSGHRAWAEELRELFRRTGQPVRVYLQDRAHLEWAVRHGYLQVENEFAGGWLVIENMKLGAGTPPAI
jgi:hypothetical protein